MRLELERSDDAEVAAGATHGPEQILVLGGAGPPKDAVGGDDVDREETVDRQPVPATQVSGAAVERQSGDTGRRDDAGRDGEPEELRLSIHVSQRRASLDAHRPRLPIDVDPSHP